tara:strand:- start:30564 stop:30821 length:258 start_codon:yes stop_codon:yes gene_type:complete
LSADPPKALKKFVDKCDLTYTLLSDESQETLKKLGVWVKKKMYGKEYLGVARSTVIVDGDNIVTHIFPKASVKGHAAEVAETLGV